MAEKRDAVSGVCEGMSCSETGNACAGDYDIETERSAASALEWRDFLKGNTVCLSNSDGG